MLFYMYVLIDDVEHVNVRFLGNLVLNLWDCGGQFRFFENYFENDNIFRNVEVLIYVFGMNFLTVSKPICLFDQSISFL